MPIDVATTGLEPAVAAFVGRLLEREPGSRLSGADVRQHPFLSSTEWELLEKRLIPAPFKPDPHLVFAKDCVRPMSEADGAPPSADESAVFSRWGYVAGGDAFAEELAEYARKHTTAEILRD